MLHSDAAGVWEHVDDNHGWEHRCQDSGGAGEGETAFTKFYPALASAPVLDRRYTCHWCSSSRRGGRAVGSSHWPIGPRSIQLGYGQEQ